MCHGHIPFFNGAALLSDIIHVTAMVPPGRLSWLIIVNISCQGNLAASHHSQKFTILLLHHWHIPCFNGTASPAEVINFTAILAAMPFCGALWLVIVNKRFFVILRNKFFFSVILPVFVNFSLFHQNGSLKTFESLRESNVQTIRQKLVKTAAAHGAALHLVPAVNFCLFPPQFSSLLLWDCIVASLHGFQFTLCNTVNWKCLWQRLSFCLHGLARQSSKNLSNWQREGWDDIGVPVG